MFPIVKTNPSSTVGVPDSGFFSAESPALTKRIASKTSSFPVRVNYSHSYWNKH